MKDKITAHFNIQLWVECPHCKDSFDVMKTDEWNSGGYEGVEFESQEGIDLELTCPQCHKEFIINDTCY